MKNLPTVIVLGAGASYCYEDGSSNIPAQNNIIKFLTHGTKARTQHEENQHF